MLQMNLFAGQDRSTDVESRRVQQSGCGGTTWERSVSMCTLPRIKRLARGKLLYSAGNSAQRSGETFVSPATLLLDLVGLLLSSLARQRSAERQKRPRGKPSAKMQNQRERK